MFTIMVADFRVVLYLWCLDALGKIWRAVAVSFCGRGTWKSWLLFLSVEAVDFSTAFISQTRIRMDTVSLFVRVITASTPKRGFNML